MKLFWGISVLLLFFLCNRMEPQKGYGDVKNRKMGGKVIFQCFYFSKFWVPPRTDAFTHKFVILSANEHKFSQRTQKASLRNKNQTAGLALNRVSFTTEQVMGNGKSWNKDWSWYSLAKKIIIPIGQFFSENVKMFVTRY